MNQNRTLKSRKQKAHVSQTADPVSTMLGDHSQSQSHDVGIQSTTQVNLVGHSSMVSTTAAVE